MKLIQMSSVKYGQVNRPYKKMDSEKAIYGKLYYHFNNFCSLASSVRVPKAATFKRFSVRPCWSPILLKLQSSITGVLQCILNKISEHDFYFKTKKGRCKYWSSVVLFESGIIYFRRDQSSDF